MGKGVPELVGDGLPVTLGARQPGAQAIGDGVSGNPGAGTPQAKGAKQAEALPRDHRPWGWFESLALGERFQVKRIFVHPGGRLSLQSHVHRAEHWIIVEGSAEVTVGETVQVVHENQSVYVPQGSVHRLANPGKMGLTLIEVQTGAYLGEDDIIRHEDVYSRD